jgi:hypothetical protein
MLSQLKSLVVPAKPGPITTTNNCLSKTSPGEALNEGPRRMGPGLPS